MYKIVEKRLQRPLDADWGPIDYGEVPIMKGEDYQNRICRLWAKKEADPFSCIIIYADREHFSNVHYFTGLDMRFEETLLFLFRDRKPLILLGNEDMNYSWIIPYDLERKLYQTFSLMGQPNDERSESLSALIQSANIPEEGKVGLIGWKYYAREKHAGFSLVSDVPHYIVETLAGTVGRDRIVNATDLMSDNTYGMKHQIDASEIVRYEILGTKNSRSVYNCMKTMSPGMTEIEASRALCIDGDPLATHPNVNFGDVDTSYGLSGPNYHERLRLGDFIGVGYGLRGSNVHKSGIYARTRGDIPQDRVGYIEEMAKPYYAAIIRWYEMMRIGTRCGEIWQMVEDWIGFEKFGLGLNPGHLAHTDEWTNSPFEKGSDVCIRSGMMLQCDFTVTFKDPYMTCHVEDGLIVADAKLRQEVMTLSPACWARIQKRRTFMKDTLGIDIADEVLPISDMPAVLFPYMADLNTVFAKG